MTHIIKKVKKIWVISLSCFF